MDNKSQFPIRPLTPEDAEASAQLHQQGMPNDFLPGFGFEFLKKLHAAIISSPETISLGFFEKNTLVGILIGSKHTRNLFRRVLRARLLTLLPYIVIRLLLHPSIVKQLLQTYIYGIATPRTIPAEIVILSVDQNFRRQGIASSLFEALIKEYKKAHTKIFIVGTTTDKKEANTFYQKMGGIFVKRFTIYDRNWHIYTFVVN